MSGSPVSRNAVTLALFAIACTGLIVQTNHSTKARIQQAQDEALMQSFAQVIARDVFDNDAAADCTTVTDAELLGVDRPVKIFRLRKNQQPVAVLINAIAPDGYSGEIELLIGIFSDGTISGVRVLTHKETPGLGDKIETAKSAWIKQFSGLSLSSPQPEKWTVKKDGGQFDAFTGATITPRAVVKAIKHAQEWFAKNRETVFDAAASCSSGAIE